MSSFPCPACGDDTVVRDSRPAHSVTGIRRRRMCVGCRDRFTTYEVAATTPPVLGAMIEEFLKKTRDAMEGLTALGREAVQIKDFITVLKNFEEKPPHEG